MQKLILYLFALFCFAAAKAQTSLGTRVQNAKFEIVKATVEFLATDVETFGKKTETRCTNCSDYKAVRQFAINNKLMKVDALINEWEKIPVDSTEQKWQSSLSYFKNRVIAKVTSGEREKRKKLPTFDEYSKSLNYIIEGVAVADNAIVTEPEPAVAGAQQEKATDTSVNLQKEKVFTNESSQKNLSLTTWLPYGIAVILLGLFIYTLLQKNKAQQRKEYYKEKAKQFKVDVEQHKQTILSLISQNKQLEQKLSDSELDRKALEDRLLAEETNKIRLTAKPNTPEFSIDENLVTKPVVQQVQVPRPKMKYARYADLGDGFSNMELSDEPDPESIFELSVTTANVGEFKITDNPDAQRYALSNAQYFLGKTCQYDSFPYENAHIRTEIPGNIKLNGGKWTIITPAKISFS